MLLIYSFILLKTASEIRVFDLLVKLLEQILSFWYEVVIFGWLPM